MSKIIKKIKLNASQVEQVNTDPTKGTQANPFTQEEMHLLQAQESWNGGYVEGVGYMMPRTSGEPDSSGSEYGERLRINGNNKDSNPIRIGGSTSFAIKVNFDWESGDPYIVPVRKRIIPVDLENSTNIYISSEFIHDVIERRITALYPSQKDVIFVADVRVSYKKLIVDNNNSYYVDATESIDCEVNLSEFAYWELPYQSSGNND